MSKNVEIIQNLEPKEVFKYFAEISDIARGSGNTDKIVGYLVNFAIKNNLKYEKDNYNNVIIIKETSNKEKSSIALQAHIDMVCVKTDDCNKDMTEEGVDFVIDGEWLTADKTSLGADDGIGMAIILSILSDENVYRRDVIGIFTNDEESGMVGARHLDLKRIDSKLFINIDSEKYGEIVLGCSSGCHLSLNKRYSCVNIDKEYFALDISLCGGLGGHSAIEITKCRMNANVMLSRVLYELSIIVKMNLVKLIGGTFDNIIPNNCEAKVLIDLKDKNIVEDYLKNYSSIIKNEYENSDNRIALDYRIKDSDNNLKGLSSEDTKNILKMLYIMPNGLIDIMLDFPDVAETSINLGKIFLNDGNCTIAFMIRSALGTKCKYLHDKIIELAKIFDYQEINNNYYPEWKYKKQSYLRSKIEEIFFKINNERINRKVTHGGLECGILLSNNFDIDAVSIGPTILNPHSVNEKLNILTVDKLYKMLKEIIIEI